MLSAGFVGAKSPVGAAKLVSLGAPAPLFMKALPKTEPPNPLGFGAAPFIPKPNPEDAVDVGAAARKGEEELPEAFDVIDCVVLSDGFAPLPVLPKALEPGEFDLNTEDVEAPRLPNGEFEEFDMAANPEAAKLVGTFCDTFSSAFGASGGFCEVGFGASGDRDSNSAVCG